MSGAGARVELPPDVAHELKNPLSVIVGYAQLLRLRKDEPTRVEAADRIMEAAERLRALIDGAASPESSALAVQRADGAGGRILIVDDDVSIRSLLRLTFPADGYHIVEAGDGDEALALVEVREPDVVLLDWNMPGRSGADVLTELQRSHPTVPVIVLTADTQAKPRQLANSLGARSFLTKPFSPAELLSTVEDLVATG